MEYPKRTETHVTETASWKLLSARTPAEWVIREVTERDYGTDCYIEIINKKGEVTGNLLSAQLKGTKSLGWPKNGTEGQKKVLFSGIEKTTVNYWMGLPVPVFLFVADLERQMVYFAPVQHQVRERYGEYLSQKTFGFELYEFAEIGADAGRVLFLAYYIRQIFFERYQASILTLLSHWAAYLRFIDENTNRDHHLGIEDDVEVLFVQIYKTCKFIAEFFKISFDIENMEEIYRKDAEAFNDSFYRLHQWSLNETLPRLRGILIEIVSKLKIHITEKEEAYWSARHPLIYNTCLNLEIEQWRDQPYW